MPDDAGDKQVGYDVGNKKPPRHSQFKPGESGNLGGRPKGRRNFTTDLLAELEEMTSVRENGLDVKVSKQRAVIKALVGNALKGDVRAATALSAMIERMPSNGGNSSAGGSNAEDQKILEDFIEREVSRRMAEAKPAKDQQA